MIAVLARPRLRMFRHRAVLSTWPERLGAGFVCVLFPLFWLLIARFVFRDPEFLYGTIHGLGMEGLNRIIINLLQAVFLVVVLVSVAEEITELFKANEAGSSPC